MLGNGCVFFQWAKEKINMGIEVFLKNSRGK
jgi:hypothetical protein